ncbi:hypothetical protein GGR57DRAFT_505703 [Xylariaceae sp. FL1272]|nr:hypothetical protein GGR57DRAFT_505703 [Xylariaceae sp. FL1272]
MDPNTAIDDPIEKLFRDLPSPNRYGDEDFDEGEVFAVLRSFDLESETQDRLLSWIGPWIEPVRKRKNPSFLHLQSEFGELARWANKENKEAFEKEDSEKSKHLKIHLWRAQGRKDEPQPPKDSDAPQEKLYQDSHAFLSDRCIYCGAKDCQIRHQNADNAISRAVSLLHDLVTELLGKTYIEDVIQEIREIDGINYIFYEESSWERGIRGDQLFSPLPSPNDDGSSKNTPPSQDQIQAAKFFGECDDVLINCQCLIDLLIKPLCEELKYQSVVPRNICRPTCSFKDGLPLNNSFLEHSVLEAKLESKESMFGWRETLADWGVWSQHRVAEANCYTREQFLEKEKNEPPFMGTRYDKVGNSIRSRLAEKMRKAIEDALTKKQLSSANQFFGLPKTSFDSLRDDIFLSAVDVLDKGLAEYQSDVRLYADSSRILRATTSQEQREALEDVWLTLKELPHVRSSEDRWTKYEERFKDPSRRDKLKAAGFDMEKLFPPPSG